MTASVRWAVLAAAIAATSGCGGPSTGSGRPAGEEPGDSSPPATSPDSISIDSTSLESTSSVDTLPVPGAVSTTPATDATQLVPLGDILDGRVAVGRRVRVKGVCIGYSRVLAVGPPPRTRSDWQLVDGGVAVWVTGPYPAGCSGMAPAEAAGTVTVVVASDTLAGLGEAPPRARIYLIHVPQA